MKPITSDEEYRQVLADEVLSREQDILLKRNAIFRHARELGMLLSIDKADVCDAILSLLPEEDRITIRNFQGGAGGGE